jgi:hypothetical protein
MRNTLVVQRELMCAYFTMLLQYSIVSMLVGDVVGVGKARVNKRQVDL